ncbi:MAG: IS200/IS605 family transposase [Planctomycetes bacterium]|nr:IS200/IS605 family transposase [Planctomycetota bacterium]
MAQTWTKLLYHVVFSTKDRRGLIAPAFQPNLHAYMGGIIRRMKGTALLVGGVTDHVHVFTSIPPTIAVSDFMRELKAGSSKWINEQSRFAVPFEWQRGYAAFTVAPSGREALERYILNQPEHHNGRSFIDELQALLDEHGVTYDPKYLE